MHKPSQKAFTTQNKFQLNLAPASLTKFHAMYPSNTLLSLTIQDELSERLPDFIDYVCRKYGMGVYMIKYDKLWKTLEQKKISQYRLTKDYGIDKSQLQRLRKNMVVKTLILNRLCNILDCRIEDIMEFIPDDEKKKSK